MFVPKVGAPFKVYYACRGIFKARWPSVCLQYLRNAQNDHGEVSPVPYSLVPTCLIQTEADSFDHKNMATGLALFLGKALSTNSANKHLRRANMILMGKQVTTKSVYKSVKNTFVSSTFAGLLLLPRER